MVPQFDEVAILKRLLAVYSPTRHEKKAVEICVQQMRDLGYEADIDGIGNAVGTIGEGPNEIVLLGHIDTVPGFIQVRQEGDTIWGRGSVDAKGPLACFISAGTRVGIRPGWKIVVIGAICEEGDSRGAYHTIKQWHPNFAIVGEPSGWDHVTLGYKGNLWLTYKVRHPLVHTSAREPNANEIAIDYWNRLVYKTNRMNEGVLKVFNQLTPSLRKIQSRSDNFSQTTTLGINLRLPPNIKIDETITIAQDLLQEGNITFRDGIPAFQAEKNTGLVRAFLSSIRSYQGHPGFLVKTGTADMNLAGPKWGCPIIAYGPGDSNFDHTPEEHIQISEYQVSIKILENVLAILTSEPK